MNINGLFQYLLNEGMTKRAQGAERAENCVNKK